MAGQKISLLPLATVLLPTDQMVIARGGLTLRLPGNAVATKGQADNLTSEITLKAPLVSAVDLYTKFFQISSFVKSSVVSYSFVSQVTSNFDKTYLTQLSAQTTFIINPTTNEPLKSGNLLTWNGSQWINGLGIEAVINQLSGVKNLDTTPIGAITQRPGIIVPLGYLACNGASVSKLTYPELFEIIGYSFGGSGNNFSVPNIAQNNGIYSYIKYTQITGTTAIDTFVTKTLALSTFIAKPTASEGQILGYSGGAWVARNVPTSTNTTTVIHQAEGIKGRGSLYWEGTGEDTYTHIDLPLVDYFEIHFSQWRTGVLSPAYNYESIMYDPTKQTIVRDSTRARSSGSISLAFFTEKSITSLAFWNNTNNIAETDNYTVELSVPPGVVKGSSFLTGRITNPSALNARFTFIRAGLQGYWVEKSSLIGGSTVSRGSGFVSTRNFRLSRMRLYQPHKEFTGEITFNY